MKKFTSFEMELNRQTNASMTDQMATRQTGTVYQVKRSTTIILGLVLVLFIVFCFVANFVALAYYFDHSDNANQSECSRPPFGLAKIFPFT